MMCLHNYKPIGCIRYFVIVFFLQLFHRSSQYPSTPVPLASGRSILFRGGRVWCEPSHPPTPGSRPVSPPALPEPLPATTLLGPPQTKLPLPGATESNPPTPSTGLTCQTGPPRTVRTRVIRDHSIRYHLTCFG